MKTLKLAGGDEIPTVGLGTWKMSPEIAHSAVANAIKMGYRHIDCAWIYNNEDGVGLEFMARDMGGVHRLREVIRRLVEQ